MLNDKKQLRNNGIWFYNFRELPDLLANVLGALLHENIPQEIYDEMEKTVSEYTQDRQNKDINEAIEKTIINNRINELTIAKQTAKDNLDKNSEE